MVKQNYALQESASIFYIGENKEMEQMAESLKEKLRFKLQFLNFKDLDAFLLHSEKNAKIKPLSVFFNPKTSFFSEKEFNGYITNHPTLKFAPLFLILDSEEEPQNYKFEHSGIRSYLTKPFKQKYLMELLYSASIYWENFDRNAESSNSLL